MAEHSVANTLVVLSRADEIGAGRLDAFQSASRIAQRYAADSNIRRLCTTVVPTAALIARPGVTPKEHEDATLRLLASLPEDDLNNLLLSADRFQAPGSSTVDVSVRARLLARLGMFGVRFALGCLRREPLLSATALADRLTARSGVPAVAVLLGLISCPGRMSCGPEPCSSAGTVWPVGWSRATPNSVAGSSANYNASRPRSRPWRRCVCYTSCWMA